MHLFGSDGIPTGIGLILIAFMFVMAVIWFFLPFTVSAIRNHLVTLIAKVDANTKAIEDLARAIEKRIP